VDDDPSVRHMLGRVLTDEGYDVVASASGAEGLRIAKDNDVNLVLLDLKMPGMSGQETLRELCAHRTDLPVIIITADARPPFGGELCGASAWLQKPLDFPGLLETIRSLVGQTAAKE